eukprot:1157126-Prymnesium_polylepis.1
MRPSGVAVALRKHSAAAVKSMAALCSTCWVEMGDGVVAGRGAQVGGDGVGGARTVREGCNAMSRRAHRR